MISMSPVTTIVVGFVLVLAGAVLAWLLFLSILPSTFFLNFLAYACSIAGIFLGLIGSAIYVKTNKKS
jgi:hypothetical protein